MTIAAKLMPLVAVPALAFLLFSSSGGPAVQVEAMDSVGPRKIEDQTQASVIRAYLGAWRSLNQAMTQNRPDLLDPYFVGRARQKLAGTIRAQQSLAIRTTYQDTSHHIRVIFYSPEGLSIELIDDVEYNVHVRNGEQSLGSTPVRTRYVAVLTPTESKWKVRVFQGGAS
jgi:hypothetical protein